MGLEKWLNGGSPKPQQRKPRKTTIKDMLLEELMEIRNSEGPKKIEKTELERKLYHRLLRSGITISFETISRYIRLFKTENYLKMMKVGRKKYYTINILEIRNYLYQKIAKEMRKT